MTSTEPFTRSPQPSAEPKDGKKAGDGEILEIARQAAEARKGKGTAKSGKKS